MRDPWQGLMHGSPTALQVTHSRVFGCPTDHHNCPTPCSQESLDILIRWQGNGHPDTMAARELLAGLEKEMMASKGGGIR